MRDRRLAITPFVLTAVAAAAMLSACTNESYYCDDTGCYTCDGLGCRPVVPDDPTPCRGDFECPDGSMCTDVGCVVEGCSADSDCPMGTVCRVDDAGHGLCVVPGDPIPVPNPGDCTTNADCLGTDLICIDGTCQLRGEEPADCTADTDCAAGQVCLDRACRDQSNTCQFNTECGPGRVCVNQLCTEGCTADSDCLEGSSCVEGFCQADPPPTDECAADSDCASGQICVSGACFDGCTADTECGEGYYCYFNRCRIDDRPHPFCTSDSDCSEGAVCRNGACRSPCTASSECPRFDVSLTYCLDMVCATTNEATSDCAAASDCDAGQSCIDGVCR